MPNLLLVSCFHLFDHKTLNNFTVTMFVLVNIKVGLAKVGSLL
uniref:Uncharacterized protein n=1 Tax=Arundo donax TaxID=35708 RepID=A0A0A9H7C2_ARUDO